MNKKQIIGIIAAAAVFVVTGASSMALESFSDKLIEENSFLGFLKDEINAEEEVEIDGAFIAKGNASGFTIAKHLGIALDNNSIVVDKNFMTNIPGIFACGDIIGGLLQVSKAVSDGALCASGVNSFLKN